MKILVIQLYRIGDVLLTTPAVRAIKRTFPEATVDFLAENPAAEILQGNPSINHVLIYDKKQPWVMVRALRAQNYDWVIDFLGTPRSAILTALSGAKLRAGLSRVFHRWAYNRKLPDPAGPLYIAEEKIRLIEPLGITFQDDFRAEISISEPATTWADHFLKKVSPLNRPLIALSPVSRRHFRRWPLQHYAALADRLTAELNCTILIIWGPGEKETAEAIATQMKEPPVIAPPIKNLLDLAALLKRADLFLGNDNGVKHIAAAAGIPTFTIFGGKNVPTNWTFPRSPSHRFIQKPCPCRENHKNESACADTPCLTAISVDEVFNLVKDFLEDIRKSPTHLVK